MHALRIPGTSLTQSVHMQHALEKRIAQLPEVERVFSRIGTAEVANDPMPPSMADTFVMIKPREDWPESDKSKRELVEELETVARSLPGNNYEFTQPIQMRMNELISGVRADVAIKVNGDDLDTLNRLAARVANIVRDVPGAADVRVEETTGLPMLVVNPDRQALSRYGLNPRDIQRTVSTAVGGTVAGQFIEGDRRADIVVRLPEQLRQSPEWLADLPIPRVGVGNDDEVSRGANWAGGEPEFVPLREVATIEQSTGQTRSTARTASAVSSLRRTYGTATSAASLPKYASAWMPACVRRQAIGSNTVGLSSSWSPPRSV